MGQAYDCEGLLECWHHSVLLTRAVVTELLDLCTHFCVLCHTSQFKGLKEIVDIMTFPYWFVSLNFLHLNYT